MGAGLWVGELNADLSGARLGPVYLDDMRGWLLVEVEKRGRTGAEINQGEGLACGLGDLKSIGCDLQSKRYRLTLVIPKRSTHLRDLIDRLHHLGRHLRAPKR